MSKLPSYKKRRRADLCAFSPEFKKRVKAVRSELGIPPDGFPMEKILNPKEPKGFYPEEARVWYKNHIQQTIGKQSKDLPHYYWHFPKELAELTENFAYSRQPCKAGFHSEVPLDRRAMDLAHEFGLPEDVVNGIKRRILVEESGSLGSSSTLQLILLPINEQEDGIKYVALVAGIDGATTQKDWLDVWRQIRMIMRMSGVETTSTKREEEKILLRDLSWWDWSKHNLTLKQIADKWEDRVGKAYAEDTIGAAIHRIDEIMRPISDTVGGTKKHKKDRQDRPQ
jgi:hypothetical protein